MSQSATGWHESGMPSGTHVMTEPTTTVQGYRFVMTWLLLNYQSTSGHIKFVESNFLARYFLYSWGFNGLIGFKFATVAMVAVICFVTDAQRQLSVARKSLGVRARIMRCGTLVPKPCSSVTLPPSDSSTAPA